MGKTMKMKLPILSTVNCHCTVMQVSQKLEASYAPPLTVRVHNIQLDTIILDALTYVMTH